MPAAPPATPVMPRYGAVTPGTYIRTRRTAAGVTLDHVAFFIRTDPATDHRELVAELREIEADIRGLTPRDRPLTERLRLAFPFDQDALERLILIHGGLEVGYPAICRLCMCGPTDACHLEGRPCGWSTTDVSICTACERRMAIAAAALPLAAEDVAA